MDKQTIERIARESGVFGQLATTNALARFAEAYEKECRAKTIEDLIAAMDERGWFSKDFVWSGAIRALLEGKK